MRSLICLTIVFRNNSLRIAPASTALVCVFFHAAYLLLNDEERAEYIEIPLENAMKRAESVQMMCQYTALCLRRITSGITMHPSYITPEWTSYPPNASWDADPSITMAVYSHPAKEKEDESADLVRDAISEKVARKLPETKTANRNTKSKTPKR